MVKHHARKHKRVSAQWIIWAWAPCLYSPRRDICNSHSHLFGTITSLPLSTRHGSMQHPFAALLVEMFRLLHRLQQGLREQKKASTNYFKQTWLSLHLNQGHHPRSSCITSESVGCPDGWLGWLAAYLAASHFGPGAQGSERSTAAK